MDNSAVAQEVATVDNEGNDISEKELQMGTAYTITSQIIELGGMDDGTKESWIQLAKAGEFHHWSGRKFKLDRSVFEAMADNLKSAEKRRSTCSTRNSGKEWEPESLLKTFAQLVALLSFVSQMNDSTLEWFGLKKDETL